MAEDARAPKAGKTDKKTAVVVVHGMGEQRPLDTLRGFVEAVWTCDRSIVEPSESQVYYKPDSITGSFELRRITTRHAPLEGGVDKRVDFFEFYWAHLMTGNTLAGFTSWAMRLLIRPPWTVPGRLVFPWLAGLIVMAVVLILLGLAALQQFGFGAKGGPAWLPFAYLAAAVAVFLFGFIASKWIVPVAADEARYLSPAPDNVAARQAIREAGIDLLDQLTRSGSYDRIVFAAHSLGAVIAYDVLNHAWGRLRYSQFKETHPKGSLANTLLNKLEEAAGALIHAEDGDIPKERLAYREAQRRYFAALRDLPKPFWLVSDLVTMGAPQSKADVLLARDADELDMRKAQRELPSCPPWLEVKDPDAGVYRFSYFPKDAVRAPHHAAVFAPVVWTNIYFPNFLLLIGDIISGAVAPRLGRGIKDIRVPIGFPRLRHTHYWKDPDSLPPRPWLFALRRAINLDMAPET